MRCCECFRRTLSVFLSYSLMVLSRLTIPKELDGWTLVAVSPAEQKAELELIAKAAAESKAEADEHDQLLQEENNEEPTAPQSKPQPKPLVRRRAVRHYINVNMAHEFTRDVPIPLLHTFDTYSAPIYIFFCGVFGNVICNGPTFLALRALSSAALDYH